MTIQKSMNSVQKQEFQNWELIVVDDCSTDDTVGRVEEVSRNDPRIRLLRQPINSGVAAARNRGIEAADGRYIAFLDSDDYWLSNKLSMQVEILKSGANVVHTSYYRRLQDGTLALIQAQKLIRDWNFYLFNPIGNLTGIYDRKTIGLFKQQTVRHEDYLMWFQIVQRAGHSVGIQEPLAVYTVNSESLSGQKSKAAIWHWTLLRQYMKLRLDIAMFGFFVYAIRSIFIRSDEFRTRMIRQWSSRSAKKGTQ
jgi:teichuronic acid biosynthesis glycosyltransferase TuaG